MVVVVTKCLLIQFRLQPLLYPTTLPTLATFQADHQLADVKEYGADARKYVSIFMYLDKSLKIK